MAYYDCMGHRDAARSQRCRSTAASSIDTAVAQLLLSTLTSDQITLALDAAEQVQQRHARAHRAADLAVQRASTRQTGPNVPSPRSSRKTGWWPAPWKRVGKRSWPL